MQRSLLLSATERPPPAPALPLLAKGFRPFFLLAASYALAMVPLWLAILNGLVPPSTHLEPSVWHAHEMLHGFAMAVIAGFLLTAVGNWTQRETATGPWLAGLALLWLTGRAALLSPSALPGGLVALIDLAFVPALMVALGRPLLATGNRRNFVMLGVLGALFATNVAVHLEGLGLSAVGTARRANLVAVDLVTLLILVIGGRVFPMFTRNATGVTSIRSLPWLDRACVGAMLLLCVGDAVAIRESAWVNTLAGLVGVLAAARAWHWGAVHSTRDPLLWILHAGYAWLVVGLLLRGAARWLGLRLESIATHAITVGAIGSLTLGMMARVSLGHSGRMLSAPKAMSAAFVAITLSAAARVLGSWLLPGLYREVLLFTAVCWTAAFGIFLTVHAPMLLAPRVDGRPG
jgi:uncharacterized protein involved in response to NO